MRAQTLSYDGTTNTTRETTTSATREEHQLQCRRFRLDSRGTALETLASHQPRTRVLLCRAELKVHEEHEPEQGHHYKQ
eukprot:5734015-Amphidinium_carterae.1